MSTMSTLHAEAQAFAEKLKTDAEHLVEEFHALVAKLLGQGETDAKQLATDAETAAKPVVAEAAHDAAALGETAVAEATQAAAAGLSPQSAPAAAPTPIVGSKPASTPSASSPSSSSEA